MQRVRDGMTEVVLTVGPGHTLRETAAAMCERQVGAAVVLDPEAPGPGVATSKSWELGINPGGEVIIANADRIIGLVAPRDRNRLVPPEEASAFTTRIERALELLPGRQG